MAKLIATQILRHWNTPSIHCNDDRNTFWPKHVRWSPLDHEKTGKTVLWLTDPYVKDWREWRRKMDWEEGEGKVKLVAWLTEPPELHPEDYEAAFAMGLYDANCVIVTSQLAMFPGCPTVEYPHGGTRLHSSDWHRNRNQLKSVSMAITEKDTLPGHKLRRELASLVGDKVDLFTGVPKFQVLDDYLFTVAIENSNSGRWFTEQLVDPFLMGCIPIYWGSLDAVWCWGFRPEGMIFCETLDELVYAASADFFRLHAMAARVKESQGWLENIRTAYEYTCPEDWLFVHNPELFGHNPSST